MSEDIFYKHLKNYFTMKKILLYILSLFLLSGFTLSGQTVSVLDYDQPGTYTYVVPAGVDELVVECWGAGGGGSAAIGMAGADPAPGAGGGGGAFAHNVIKVTQGQSFTIIVGAGGATGTNPYTLGDGDGRRGGSSSVSNSSGTLVIAEGGRGATFVKLKEGGSKGGVGGRFLNCTGSVIHIGGDGADAGADYSGGGGGAGGASLEGYNAVGMDEGGGGSCYFGIAGSGGAGRNTTGDGNPGINTLNAARGVTYAGGAGGGGYDEAYGTKNGGKGANGYVRIKAQYSLGEITGRAYMEVGATTQLTPPVEGGEWSSSLTNVASVDKNGLVRGLNPGKTVITYSIGDIYTGRTSEIIVTVYPVGHYVTVTGLREYCVDGSNQINLEASTMLEGDLEWFWTGPDNFFWGDAGFTREPTLENAGIYTVTLCRFADGAPGKNILVNGDFEQGNTGFSSEYSYNQWGQQAGDYNVGTLPLNWAFSESCGDHTSGSGNYLSVMGNNTAKAVWKQTVDVLPNTNYHFSYWMQSMQASNYSFTTDIKIRAKINGVALGDPYARTSSKTCNDWLPFIHIWNSGNNTSVEIVLELVEPITSEYCLGLDDIRLRQISDEENSLIVTDVDIEVGTSFTPTIEIACTPEVPMEGMENLFNASVEYAGLMPGYVWYVNDIVAQTGPNSFFISTDLVQGDVVKCELVPDEMDCTVGDDFFSNSIIVESAGPNYWIGLLSTEWEVAENWTRNKVLENGEDLEFATINNYGTAAQNDLEVSLNVVVGDYINESDKKLIINPGKSIIIEGQINTDNKDKIYIQDEEDSPNGSLIFPNAEPPYATIELWSKAYIDPDERDDHRFKWLFFGIPVKGLTASPTFDGAYIRKYNEAKVTSKVGIQWESLSNNSIIEPFAGYEISHDVPRKFIISGKLIKDNFRKVLPVSPASYYRGQHLLANPYTAAIKVSEIEFGAGLEHTVYIYNCGSFLHWETITPVEGGIHYEYEANPGQYTVIPRNQSPVIGEEIPSMESFLIKVLNPEDPQRYTDAERTIAFDYETVITPNTVLQRSKPEKDSSIENKVFLSASVNSENYEDKTWLFIEEQCGPGFDNGWDGYKIHTSASIAQLFIVEDNIDYHVSSTNDIHGIYLGFRAGQGDTEYTLNFRNKNLSQHYQSLYLLDLETGKVTNLLTDSTQYHFTAMNTANAEKRFKIISRSLDPDNEGYNNIGFYYESKVMYIDNPHTDSGKFALYDASGRLVVQSNFAENSVTPVSVALPTGVYIARATCNGKEEVERIIIK